MWKACYEVSMRHQRNEDSTLGEAESSPICQLGDQNKQLTVNAEFMLPDGKLEALV